MDKLNGIVKFFKKDSAWGFISCDQGEYFVHKDNVLDENKNLYYGEMVEFDIISTTKGEMAVDVRRKRPDTKLGKEASAKTGTPEVQA